MIESLDIRSDTAELDRVRELVADVISKDGFPAELTNRIQVAVDEAVTNIIEHAFGDLPAGSGCIRIGVEADASRFRIEITDDGPNDFSGDVGDIDMQAHVAAGRDGGLGVFLIRRIMDEVDYGFTRGQRNRLVMTKYAEST